MLCILAGLYALPVVAYIFAETGQPSGSRDFHPFWYAGHFIHQGRDPYAAYLGGEHPRLPIQYIDGVLVDQPVLHEHLSLIPTNTPIMLLFLSLFSKFSWAVAKWLFLAFNLIVMALTAWLVLRRIPFAGVKLARIDEILIALLYFDFSATRIALENGQTTLLVFFMMLLAVVYAKSSWLLAGLALGMAFSKYSLSLPLFFFFLYKRDFRILLVAMAVQGVGLLGLAAITQSSPVVIVQENIRVLAEVFDQPGVHLSHFLRLFTENRLFAEIPVLLITLLVCILLFRWLRKRTRVEEVVDLHLITALFIWTLLVGYHRQYDTLILIVFVVLAFKGLTDPNLWRLTDQGRSLLLAFMTILSVLMVVPARIVDRVLPGYYGRVGDSVMTIFLLIALAVAMLLLQRLLQNSQTQPVTQRVETHDL